LATVHSLVIGKVQASGGVNNAFARLDRGSLLGVLEQHLSKKVQGDGGIRSAGWLLILFWASCFGATIFRQFFEPPPLANVAPFQV
jgi:hypothetical protein